MKPLSTSQFDFGWAYQLVHDFLFQKCCCYLPFVEMLYKQFKENENRINFSTFLRQKKTRKANQRPRDERTGTRLGRVIDPESLKSHIKVNRSLVARITWSYTRLSLLLFARMIESDSKFEQSYEYDDSEFNFIPGSQTEVEETTINEQWTASPREFDLNVFKYTAISIYVVGSKLQAYITFDSSWWHPQSSCNLIPLETPIFLSSKWLAIGDLRCMDEALLILLKIIH